MMAVLFFLIKAYLVFLALAGVFNVVAFAIKGTHELLGIDPYKRVWLSLAIAWVIMGGFLYLVGHIISGILTPVSGR
jgi:hypothetical protein